MEKRWAISDIHGNGRQFIQLLDYVDTDPEQMVICGDLCDRGLDTWGVFEEVAQLIDEGCTVVMGNHDYWYFNYLDGNMPAFQFEAEDVGGRTTIVSMELAIERLGAAKVGEVINKIHNNMVPYYETEDFIFVHAGLDPRLPDMSRQNPKILMEGSKEWSNPMMHHSFDQVVVFGHTPTFRIHKNITEDEATVWFSRQRRKLGIDTGAGFGCRLTMVDLQKGKAYAYDFTKHDIIEYQFMNPKGFKRRYY